MTVAAPVCSPAERGQKIEWERLCHLDPIALGREHILANDD
jgi:hypothetical protein